MKTSELHTSIEKIDVDKSTKEGVLEIIDLKIESDMNTFSQELKSFREIMDARTTSLKEEIHGLKWSMNLIVGILIAILTVILTAILAVVVKNYF